MIIIFILIIFVAIIAIVTLSKVSTSQGKSNNMCEDPKGRNTL